jgi:hypothetical protein
LDERFYSCSKSLVVGRPFPGIASRNSSKSRLRELTNATIQETQ